MCEVCVDSVASAIAAEKGGAKRIELCANLFEGGTTPSAGMILQVQKLPIHVMIRPRGGDFCYSQDEFEVMKQDIQICKSYGVHGVVLGILLPSGIILCYTSIDVERTKELAQLVSPLLVTFHRAIDMTVDIYQALDDIISIGGIQRVLTSGGEASCMEGIDILQQLVQRAANRIIIMPGGDIGKILLQTKATEFHVSGRVTQESPMLYKNTAVFLGGALRPAEYQLQIVDEKKIAAFFKQ